MKTLRWFLVGLLIVVWGVWQIQKSPRLQSVLFPSVQPIAPIQSPSVPPTGPIVTFNGHVFRVEVADTPEEQMLGFGGRESLCEDCGMLFVFDRPDRHAFWMKDMHFPIDVLWLEGNNIVHIEHSVSHLDQEKVYTPPENADRVLEINAGLAEQYGIVVGDAVLFDL